MADACEPLCAPRLRIRVKDDLCVVCVRVVRTLRRPVHAHLALITGSLEELEFLNLNACQKVFWPSLSIGLLGTSLAGGFLYFT